jgi:hypothetical protein
MNMSISTRATYDPEVLNENETRINRLRLYVFDGSTLDKMYYWSDLNINNGVYVTPTFLVKAATGKTFYAIVNEPTDMDSRALLEAVDHPGDLAEIQYRRRDIMDYWNPNIMGYYNDYCLPMYGELTGIDAETGSDRTNVAAHRTGMSSSGQFSWGSTHAGPHGIRCSATERGLHRPD